jgi:NAD(P)-dependent dehydrogenase (short-subunit alcohol dehydrogenase family)
VTRLALVTGGSRGVGACVVTQLQAAGWDVLAPGRAELDFDDPNSVNRYWLHFGLMSPQLDALVMCHGTWFSKPFNDHCITDYALQMRQRYFMPFELIGWMLPYLKKGTSPSITIVSSTQAFGGRAETGPYAAACAAQVRLALGLAHSLPAVRTNAVCPGLTATGMAAQVIATGDCRPDAVPQPVEAVAAVIVGLVTDDASNGRVVRVVDGKASDAKWVWA